MNDILSVHLISNIEVNKPALPKGSVRSFYKEHFQKLETTCDADGAAHSSMLISFCDQKEEAGSYGELHNVKCCSSLFITTPAKSYKLPEGRQ